jgi:hypothetical protein
MDVTGGEFDKAKKAIDDLKISMGQARKIQLDMNKGLGEYSKTLINIAEQQKNINFIESQLLKTKTKIAELETDLNKETEKNKEKIAAWQKEYESGNEKTKKIAKQHLTILHAQTVEIKTQLAAQKGAKAVIEQKLELQKKELELTKEAAKEANLLLATWRSLGKLPGLSKKWGFDKMKSWGVFDMDKEIRNAARSMNVGNKDFAAFSKNISNAAQGTVTWGVNAKELAKMQQGYSEAIGRSVELTEEGHRAMALMAEGTGLGTEFAVQMATEMDKFGASAKTAKDLVAGTVKQAGKVGVNGAAASKKLVSLLKLSQTYVFKGGQEGLKKMASDAERLKLDLEGAAGMAEKVMRPEGAVETAALLTTMGGEFSKLGDPFQLMFKARNDFAGFAKDLGKASSEFVEFNEQTGAFDIKGGLARDRMLEISKITGIQMDKLQEMAVAEKKLQMIQGKTPVGITSEEDKQLIASLTEVGKGGELMIKLRGKDPLNIDQLTPKMLEKYKKDQNTLEESALQARTFAEVVEDLFTSFKQTLLPFVNGLKTSLGEPLQELMKEWKTNGFYNKLQGWGEKAGQLLIGLGKFAKMVGRFIAELPELSAALYLLFGPAKWLINGRLLGQGFMSIAGKGMGGVTSSTPGYGQTNGLIGPAERTIPPPMGRMQRMLGGNVMGGKFAAGTMGSYGATAGLGMAGMGLNAMRGEEGSAGYNSGAGKALGIGSSALSGAAAGMMFGPWGALAGGVLGLGYGAYNEFSGANAERPSQINYDDALISSDGKNNGGPGTRIQFNPHDKFMSFDDVMIAGTNAGANNKLYEDITGKGNKKGSNTNVKGKFNHSGEILLKLDDTEIGRIAARHIKENKEAALLVTQAVHMSINSKGGKTTGKSRGPLN